MNEQVDEKVEECPEFNARVRKLHRESDRLRREAERLRRDLPKLKQIMEHGDVTFDRAVAIMRNRKISWRDYCWFAFWLQIDSRKAAFYARKVKELVYVDVKKRGMAPAAARKLAYEHILFRHTGADRLGVRYWVYDELIGKADRRAKQSGERFEDALLRVENEFVARGLLQELTGIVTL